jgi:ectoine hydroxylase-related dioxygenase (phytanoyl-CoA dioxygenase family)
MRLSGDEMAAYAADGFLIRREVFSRGEVEELRNAVERAAARALELCADGRTYHLDGRRFVDAGHVTVQFEHRPGSNTIRVIEPVHELDDRLDRLLDDPRIVEPMRDLVGTDAVAVWTDKLNLKRAGEGSGFGWHQDSPYWIHDSGHVDQLPNVLVALDDADEHNGCFRVIRGSHTHGCLPGTADGTQLGGFFTDPSCFDERDQVAMTVPAGSLVFFSPHSVHGSFPNPSDRPRRALVLTYQPADHAMLKSGRVRNAGESGARLGG